MLKGDKVFLVEAFTDWLDDGDVWLASVEVIHDKLSTSVSTCELDSSVSPEHISDHFFRVENDRREELIAIDPAFKTESFGSFEDWSFRLVQKWYHIPSAFAQLKSPFLIYIESLLDN